MQRFRVLWPVQTSDAVSIVVALSPVIVANTLYLTAHFSLKFVS
jgi:hypothetical protein